LVLVARRRDALESLAAQIRTQYGVRVEVLAIDLSVPAAVDQVVETTAPWDIGCLVAAAGFGTSGDFLDGALDDELAMIDVNCRAVAALAHAFGRRFVSRGRGGIVLMSSLVAFQGVPRAANYAATKAYIQSFAEGLRLELGPRGVDVVASAPGPVASGFAERAAMTMSNAESPLVVARGTLRALGRWGTVRPGFLAKFLEASLKLLPRWGRVRMMAVVMAGMTPRPAGGHGQTRGFGPS
jgi:short-subunit dehydrogenase